ncbi:hypothetical protein ACWD3I_34605 [Streptomyces sp. NPDC002817]|uniref:hypothetical protein n=1 Tax=Streptomyces sp. NPDC088357 TaxID=3154655 RepID=UPI00342AF3E1
MGAGILLVPMTVYVVLMALFCVKVGDKTSWKVGWAMAAACVFLPLALVIAMAVA